MKDAVPGAVMAASVDIDVGKLKEKNKRFNAQYIFNKKEKREMLHLEPF